MNINRILCGLAVVGLCLGMVSLAGAAAVFGGGGIYTQNFDSIGPAGTAAPTDWIAGNYSPVVNRVLLDSSPSAMNSVALVVDDGSSGTKATSYNYGTTGQADRAIGQIPTTSSGDRGLQVALFNNTGAPITALNIQYAGEQWRDYQGTAEIKPERIRMYISPANNAGYIYMGSSLDFNAPQDNGTDSALDGNLPANRAVLSDTVDLTAIGYPNGAVAPSEIFYLTWHDWNDNRANDHGLAVDDVSIGAVPEPASLTMAALGLLGLIGFSRRRRG